MTKASKKTKIVPSTRHSAALRRRLAMAAIDGQESLLPGFGAGRGATPETTAPAARAGGRRM